jgi:hypothetical protein
VEYDDEMSPATSSFEAAAWFNGLCPPVTLENSNTLRSMSSYRTDRFLMRTQHHNICTIVQRCFNSMCTHTAGSRLPTIAQQNCSQTSTSSAEPSRRIRVNEGILFRLAAL